MNHDQYMYRCLQLAKLGSGNVAPNPMVGCVIVYEDKIIGESWHQEFGKPHAEVNAIDDVKDVKLLSKSTLYVSLEPCSHHGKTPPCVDLIIHHKIPKVVVGITDPFAKVNGEGIRKLRDAGIEVVIPVLEFKSRELNKRFFTFHNHNRPYIILKWAQSKDGFIGKKTERVLISNKLSQLLVHKWRSEEHAIMIGTNTALIDNPMLNVREWFGKSSVRIAIDKNLKLPAHLNIFDGNQQTLVFTTKEKSAYNNLKYIQLDEKDFTVGSMLKSLHRENIQSVLVEGGAKLLQSFIDDNLWDEAIVIKGNIFLSGGIKSPDLNLAPTSTRSSWDDVISYYQNQNAV